MLAKSEKEFIELFNTVEDPRDDNKTLFPVNEILFLCLTGIISCAESWREIIDYGKQNIAFLRKFFPYVHGIPSKSVLSRVFRVLNKKQLALLLFNFNKLILDSKVLSPDETRVIALDGKRLRNSKTHLLHAFATKQGIVLAQEEIENKVNESTSIPNFIKNLDIKNAVVTADALNCQANIAESIIAEKGDYLLAVKGNQKNLKEEIESYFTSKTIKKHTSKETLDKGHGRLEVRSMQSIDLPPIFKKNHPKWPHAKSICKLESTRIIKDKETKQIRYYISSTKAQPELQLNYAREHWGIENKLHWVLDVVFNEDKSTLSMKSAQNIAVLRKVALNTIKNYKEKTGDPVTIRGMRKRASWSTTNLEKLIKYLTTN